MIDRTNLDRLIASNSDVLDNSGNKIGSLGQLYLDDRTDDPNWATVKTGLFGTSETFVPLDEATVDGNNIRVPYTKDEVKDAPRVDVDQHLSPEDEDLLYRHYGLSAGKADTYVNDTDINRTYTTDTTDTTDTDVRAGYTDADGAGTVGYDSPTTDDAMTRSEERLHVGTEKQEVGRARLRKYIVTENVTQTVPVSREEVRIEREPITDANRGAAMSGPDLSEEEHEVTLHAERPVVEKETVPVERVRLETDTVTDQETVSEQVRKEEIETDDDITGRRER